MFWICVMNLIYIIKCCHLQEKYDWLAKVVRSSWKNMIICKITMESVFGHYYCYCKDGFVIHFLHGYSSWTMAKRCLSTAWECGIHNNQKLHMINGAWCYHYNRACSQKHNFTFYRSFVRWVSAESDLWLLQ